MNKTITEAHWAVLAANAGRLGEEFDWVALDRAGFLSTFSSAEEGPVPSSLWAWRIPYLTLAARFETLPSHRPIEKVFRGDGTYQDWWEYAYRGLFAFDYQGVDLVFAFLRRLRG